ncbi:MAG: hypothetical protein LBT80_01555 [Lactobacillaceae bacterium]|jgi:hypothetical protein|nr:hypothetical protein [Lactobacillaceae bacterium]
MTDHVQGHISAYVDLLTDDVQAVERQLGAIRLLNETDDAVIVHDIAGDLANTTLATEWVVAPRQFERRDWYLMAMHRFMSFAGITGYNILIPEDREELTLVIEELNVPNVFQFVLNDDANGGVYFTEMGQEEKLFYWSLEKHQIFFNSHAITNLLVANYRTKTTANQIRPLANLLREFGRYMEREFKYDVDYNILETADNFIYPMVQSEMPAGMIDRLFVLSAESHYFLQGMPNGAAMLLNNDVELRVFYDENTAAIGGQEWHFQVIDGQDALSLLDVLLDYDFIGTWYLKERKTIEVASRELVFNGGPKKPAEVKGVQVELLLPREVY